MSAEPTSIRVSGHELMLEGKVVGQWKAKEGKATCSCGTHSPHLLSQNARKRWHRQHKGDVLAARAASSTEEPTP